MTERNAGNDDIKTCPICNSREGLIIRWHPDIGKPIHEYTEIGCTNCDKYFRGEEDIFPITEWNLFVIDENKKKRRVHKYEELYRLLHAHNQNEKAGIVSRNAIDEYLETNISSNCPYKTGNRFKFREPHRGIWSAVSVRSVYGTNTGPFWILTAREVLKSGRLGENKGEFWQREERTMIPIEPFWKPYTWSQVIVGDDCRYNENAGVITEANHLKHKAIISVNEEIIEINKLSELGVPTLRVEE